MSDLTPEQYTWLSVFSGKSVPPPPGIGDDVVASIEFQKRRAEEDRSEIALKAMMLEQATAMVEKDKEAIRKAFTFEAELATEKEGKTEKVSSKGRQDQALDSDEIRHDTKLDDSKLSAQKKYFDLIMTEQKKLEDKQVQRTESYDVKTKTAAVKSHHLFEKKEIMVGFYTPMVREDVLPENFVPKRFSETQQMLDATNEEYLKEIKEKGSRIPTGAAAAIKSAIKVAGSVTDAILVATTGVTVKDGVETLRSTSDVGLSGEWQARAVAITDGITAVLTSTVDVVDTGVTAYLDAKYDQSAWQAIANSLAAAVGKLVAGGYGNATLGATVADGLATGIGALGVVSTVAVWAKSHPRGPFPVDGVLSGLGSAVGSAMATGSDQTAGNTSKMFVIISQEVTAGFNIAAKTVSAEFIELAGKGELGKAFAMLGQTATSEVCKGVVRGLAGFNYIATDDKLVEEGDKSGEAATAQSEFKDLQRILVQAEKSGDVLEKGFDEKLLATINDKVAKDVERLSGKTMAELAKKAKEADEKQEEEHAKTEQQLLEAKKKEYVESLERLTADAPMGEEDFKSIAKLTEQIERDKAIVKMAYNIASIGLAMPGVAVAKELIAPLKAAGDLVKFVQNLHAAIERIIALQKWFGSKREATSARSPYLTSIENFIKNNQELLTHNSIQALLLLSKSISGFAETAFPIAKVATVSLDLAVTLEDAVFTLYKQQQLVRAWEATELALDNPNNRKLGLIARGLNPTLAKYSIAYGAVIAKSSTAVSAMNKVGLDRESLMRPDAKMGDVKQFLQSLYSDDNIVLGKRDEKKQALKLPKAELTLKAWTTTFYIWQNPPPPEEGKAGFNKVIAKNPAAILSGLTRVETGKKRVETLFVALASAKQIDEQDKHTEAIEQAGEQLVAALQALELAFRAFEPTTEAGSSYDAKYAANGYADLAAAECSLVDRNLEARLEKVGADVRQKALALAAMANGSEASESDDQDLPGGSSSQQESSVESGEGDNAREDDEDDLSEQGGYDGDLDQDDDEEDEDEDEDL